MICDSCGREVGPIHWYKASGKPRCWKRRWSQADDFRLMQLWEQGKSDAEIAAVLGMTHAAVNLHRKRIGIKRHTAHRAVLNCRDVARMLGLGCAKTVTRWIERGWLAGKPGKGVGRNRLWIIRASALQRFLADERYWHNWQPERITDPELRRYVDEVRGDVRFLTQREAADRFGVVVGTINSWIEKGWLTGYRPGDRGNHLVRKDEVERLAATYVWGDGLKEAA